MCDRCLFTDFVYVRGHVEGLQFDGTNRNAFLQLVAACHTWYDLFKLNAFLAFLYDFQQRWSRGRDRPRRGFAGLLTTSTCACRMTGIMIQAPGAAFFQSRRGNASAHVVFCTSVFSVFASSSANIPVFIRMCVHVLPHRWNCVLCCIIFAPLCVPARCFNALATLQGCGSWLWRRAQVHAHGRTNRARDCVDAPSQLRHVVHCHAAPPGHYCS